MTNFTNSKHGNNVTGGFGGVLWNPKVFRRFLPAKFFRVMTNELIKKGYECFNFQPVEMHRVYAYSEYEFIKVLNNCKAHESLENSKHYKDFIKFKEDVQGLLKEFYGGTEADPWKIMNTVCRCLSSDPGNMEPVIHQFKEDWLEAVTRHGYIPSLARTLFRRCSQEYIGWINDMNILMYDKENDQYYKVSPRYATRESRSIDWNEFVSPAYVPLFESVGDPSEFTYDAVVFWRRGLFFAYIDYALYYDGRQLDETKDKLERISKLDDIDSIFKTADELMPEVREYLDSFAY